MEFAKKLLLHDGLKVYEVADRVGYRDVKYFTELFKERTGMTPGEFRNTKV